MKLGIDEYDQKVDELTKSEDQVVEIDENT